MSVAHSWSPGLLISLSPFSPFIAAQNRSMQRASLCRRCGAQLLIQRSAAALIALERACDITGARIGLHQHAVERLAQPILLQATPRQTNRRSIGIRIQPQL